MKLLIVTVVEQFEKEVLRLFKSANIENFSGSDIDGYKNPTAMVRAAWFPSEKSGVESGMFFSFTKDENIDILFAEIKKFNENLETYNPIKAVVVPIERAI